MKKKIIELHRMQDIDEMDWQLFKKLGVDGVMIPLGSSDYYGGISVNDFAESCIEAAEENSLEVGVIVEIRCKDAFSAHEAAYNTAEFLKEYKNAVKLGIAFGFFEKKHSCLIEQGTDGLTDTALALLFETERLGYRGMICTDFVFADTYMDISRIRGKRFWGESAGKWDGRLIMRRIGCDDADYISKLDAFGQNIME